MKKLILTAAAAMMVLASCTKTTVESIDGPKEIAFRTIESNLTKASLAGYNDGSLGVFSYYNNEASLYFDNTKFAQVGNFWAGSKYWPLDKNLDFVVYAPYIANNTGEDQITFDHSSKTLKFTIVNNVPTGEPLKQNDYLYGIEFYNNDTDQGYNKSTPDVDVKLRHALSKITVNVSATATSGGIYTINTLQLHEAHVAGTINIVYDPATEEAGTPNCVLADPAVNPTYTFPEFSGKTAETTVLTSSYYVFPSHHQTKFIIKYKIAGSESVQTKEIDLSSSTWESGKHYIYNIVYSANEILFDPDVEVWNPSGDEVRNETL